MVKRRRIKYIYSPTLGGTVEWYVTEKGTKYWQLRVERFIGGWLRKVWTTRPREVTLDLSEEAGEELRITVPADEFVDELERTESDALAKTNVARKRLELVDRVRVDRLGVYFEWYRTTTGRIVLFLRDIRTGEFVKKPPYVKVTIHKRGNYDETKRAKKGGTHPVYLEFEYYFTVDLEEFAEAIREGVQDAWKSFVDEEDLLAKEVDILMNTYAWDDRAIEMIYSRYWYNKILGIEYEFSEIEEEDTEVIFYGH